jgi:hypothetical protein
MLNYHQHLSSNAYNSNIREESHLSYLGEDNLNKLPTLKSSISL